MVIGRIFGRRKKRKALSTKSGYTFEAFMQDVKSHAKQRRRKGNLVTGRDWETRYWLYAHIGINYINLGLNHIYDKVDSENRFATDDELLMLDVLGNLYEVFAAGALIRYYQIKADGANEANETDGADGK